MNPRNTKLSYPTISEATDVSVENIKIINSFYWKSIKKHLSNLQSPSVFITGLGEMKIKEWTIDSTINELSNKAKKWENKNIENPIFTSYSNDLQKVQQLKQMVSIEKERKAEYKSIREEYENRQCDQTLEK